MSLLPKKRLKSEINLALRVSLRKVSYYKLCSIGFAMERWKDGLKHKDPDYASGSVLGSYGLWQRGCVLREVFVVICIGNGKIRIGAGEVHRACLSVDHVIGASHYIEVAHFMNECASLGVSA